jgi:crotonobetainyl-CoA:carnitine CoA-transferase CaiB-like acyl-CoA transferase
MGDLGAEVLKLESLKGDDSRRLGPPFVDGDGIFFHCANGGKQSLALDLSSADGRRLILRLCETVDVLVENFRPGLAEQMGLSYAAIRERNPRIVYCSISGFGSHGPMARRGGVDTVFQATGGAVGAIDAPESGPVKFGSPIADITAAHSATLAIMAALLERSKTGIGTRIEVSIRDALATLMVPVVTYALMTGENPPRARNASQFAAPADIYRTADGHIALSVINDKHWMLLCAAIDCPELARDPRFASPESRLENKDALGKILHSRLATESTATWEEHLNSAGIPAGGIRTIADLVEDEQFGTNGLFVMNGHQKAMGLPFKFDGSAFGGRGPAPRHGEHSLSILAKSGIAEEEIKALLEAGAISAADADSERNPREPGETGGIERAWMTTLNL